MVYFKSGLCLKCSILKQLVVWNHSSTSQSSTAFERGTILPLSAPLAHHLPYAALMFFWPKISFLAWRTTNPTKRVNNAHTVSELRHTGQDKGLCPSWSEAGVAAAQSLPSEVMSRLMRLSPVCNHSLSLLFATTKAFGIPKVYTEQKSRESSFPKSWIFGF